MEMGSDDNHNSPREYDLKKPPSITIVLAIADYEGIDPVELDFTLYNHVHPNALDRLCESGDVDIVFTINQYEIHIIGNDVIRISK